MKLLRHEVRHWSTERTRGFVLAGETGPDKGVLYQGRQTLGSDVWELERWSFKTEAMRPVLNQDVVLEVLKTVACRCQVSPFQTEAMRPVLNQDDVLEVLKIVGLRD